MLRCFRSSGNRGCRGKRVFIKYFLDVLSRHCFDLFDSHTSRFVDAPLNPIAADVEHAVCWSFAPQDKV